MSKVPSNDILQLTRYFWYKIRGCKSWWQWWVGHSVSGSKFMKTADQGQQNTLKVLQGWCRWWKASTKPNAYGKKKELISEEKNINKQSKKNILTTIQLTL